MKYLAWLVIYLSSILTYFTGYGQSPAYNIKGAVLDSESHRSLPLATVYVKSQKDSSLVTYALTDEKGGFFLKNIPRDQSVLFMIFYTGYQGYKRVMANIGEDTVKMGPVYLSMSSNELSAITVIGERPPIAIKGDTIEFNASSFHARPNSVLAGLLKKLPGVVVDLNGNITANGKSVDRILVNGKKFFGNDFQIALKNLPAAIVDKVQITNTKTREEELTGKTAEGNTKTINVTLKKGKDHGVFGRAYAGYGTDNHYDASALMNYFEGKRQISLLGAMNNINQIGFTANEIKKMMGGGVHSVYNGINGSFGINGMQFGSEAAGVKKSGSAGFNYNDDFGDHFSVNGSYFYDDLKLNNETKTARKNFLPDSVFYYKSDNTSYNNNYNQRYSAGVNYKDSSWRIYYDTDFSTDHSKGTNRNNALSTRAKGAMINQSNSLYRTDEQTKQLMNHVDVFRTFKQKGQFLGLHVDIDNRSEDGNNYINYYNIFYNNGKVSDSVNQYIVNNQNDNHYLGRLTYLQPVSRSIKLNIEFDFEWQNNLTDKRTYDLDGSTGKYTIRDTAYSNKFRSNIIRQTPRLGLIIQLDSDKWAIQADAKFNFIGLHHFSFNHDIAFDQNQFFISPRISIRRKTRSGIVELKYYSNLTQPGIFQLLPIADNTNPLYIIIGNPDLRSSIFSQISLSYSGFNLNSGSYFDADLEYNFTKNNITSVTSYDSLLRQLATYTNVKGDNGGSIKFGFGKIEKKKDNRWDIRLNTRVDYHNDHAFVNDVLYSSKSYAVGLSPSITYGYQERFEVASSYQLNYKYNKYDIQYLNDQKNMMQQATLSCTLYWPDRVVWESDLNYAHNSDVVPGIRKGYWLWNTAVGLDIFKKKQATIQLSVYDLLNQSISLNRTITPTYIEDRQTVILHRYFMLKLIYNLRKFDKKKAVQN
jgi:hypothetical protein